jgi:hypothetical protein
MTPMTLAVLNTVSLPVAFGSGLQQSQFRLQLRAWMYVYVNLYRTALSLQVTSRRSQY